MVLYALPFLDGIFGSKGESRRHWNSLTWKLDGEFWSAANKVLLNIDETNIGTGQSQKPCQLSGQILVYENSWVLRVVLEFEHIEVSIGTTHQVRL